MAQVRAKVVCFIDNGLRQAGDTFDYNGPFNGNLEYLNGEPAITKSSNDGQQVALPRRRGRPPKLSRVTDNAH